MKPKGANGYDDGLLEYIEDIIGTSHYNEKIVTARELVDSIDTQRDQMMVKVKLAENEKNNLEVNTRCLCGVSY